MHPLKFAPVLALLAPLSMLWPHQAPGAKAVPAQTAQEKAVRVQYLEIVTPEVDATCASLAELHGVTFGEPEPLLGQARTASLRGGGKIGVRAPMRADEAPVVRPYALVDDIEAAIATAEAAGGVFAMKATRIPGHGTFAIYVQGGIDHGLWQL